MRTASKINGSKNVGSTVELTADHDKARAFNSYFASVGCHDNNNNNNNTPVCPDKTNTPYCSPQ